jgi:hypothetical protein
MTVAFVDMPRFCRLGIKHLRDGQSSETPMENESSDAYTFYTATLSSSCRSLLDISNILHFAMIPHVANTAIHCIYNGTFSHLGRERLATTICTIIRMEIYMIATRGGALHRVITWNFATGAEGHDLNVFKRWLSFLRSLRVGHQKVCTTIAREIYPT